MTSDKQTTDYSNVKKSEWDKNFDFYPESSNLKVGRYNSSTNTLQVDFKKKDGTFKGSYNYYDVPEDEVNMLIEQTGRDQDLYFRENIQRGAYTCERFA